MKRLVFQSLFLCLLSLTGTARVAAPPGRVPVGVDESAEVARVVRDAVDRALAVLKNPELSQSQKRDQVTAIVEPLIDFELLAMLSLGKTHWSRIDAGQRETFTELFVETLKMSYVDKLKLFTDEEVEFEAPVPITTKGSPKYFVMTYILSKGSRIKVAYELAKRPDGWRVYDFEIEGVSVRKSYGSQYNDFLREKPFDELLSTMRRKLAESKQRDSEEDQAG